jgi:hypothetical protein
LKVKGECRSWIYQVARLLWSRRIESAFARALRGNPVFINPAPNAKVHFFQMFLQS